METEEDETPSSASGSLSPSSSSSASASACSSSAGVCLELWHACAGPLISLPKRGSRVLYFPQGHLEQAPDFSAAIYGLPPHVFCRILDVKLHVCLYNLHSLSFFFSPSFIYVLFFSNWFFDFFLGEKKKIPPFFFLGLCLANLSLGGVSIQVWRFVPRCYSISFDIKVYFFSLEFSSSCLVFWKKSFFWGKFSIFATFAFHLVAV